MKKAFILFVIAALILGLAACTTNREENPSENLLAKYPSSDHSRIEFIDDREVTGSFEYLNENTVKIVRESDGQVLYVPHTSILRIWEGDGQLISTETAESETSPVNSEAIPSAVGSYKTDSWNGGSAALVIIADGTCMHPSGARGTWTQDGTTISILLAGDDRAFTAELVDGGVIMHAKFFERVS